MSRPALPRPDRRPTLAVPPADALQTPSGAAQSDDIISNGRGRPHGSRPDRAARRVLRSAGALALIAAAGATLVPVPRTVTLDGHLVPARTVLIRAEEPGLLTHVLVAPGDTVQPGALVARLQSPALDEAFRTADRSRLPWTLLARRARLDVHAPPFAERHPDGSTDASTLWRGGVVLTEGLSERRGARLDAGDVVVELAALATDGRTGVPLVVRAWADERDAPRVRPGMPARLTVSALLPAQPRQASGRVARVGLVPDPARPPDAPAPWRVEIAVDAHQLGGLLPPASTPTPSLLRAGFSVDVAVVERRETLAATAVRWLRARHTEQSMLLKALSRGPAMPRPLGYPRAG